MDYYQLIASNFQATIEVLAMSVDDLAEPIAQGSQLMSEALLADRKILCCGNGADAALAQLLACSLLDQYERERPALPALSLAADSASVTAIGDSLGIEEIFSRQVRALGQPRDILVCINSNPSTPRNLQQAFGAAAEREMQTLVISAGKPADTAGNPDMVTIGAGTGTRHRTIEIQTMIIHCLCELLDQHLFGPIHRES